MNTQTQRLGLGAMENNVWLIFAGNEVLIIDASFETEPIVEAVRDYRPVGIVLTHGHFDHINAAVRLREQLDHAPIYLHPDDQFLWHEQHPDADYDQKLSDKSELQIGKTHARVLHTPGHTPGSVCYYFPKLDTVFTGDTLFPGGAGATRWEYSDFDQIIESIRDQLFTLPRETYVSPGHGESTTIGEEKPKLDEWAARRW